MELVIFFQQQEAFRTPYYDLPKAMETLVCITLLLLLYSHALPQMRNGPCNDAKLLSFSLHDIKEHTFQ
jgi:hypothetical protein